MSDVGIIQRPPIARAPCLRPPGWGMRDPSLVLHIKPSQAGYLKKESDGDPPRERDVDPIAWARDLSGKGNHPIQNTTADKPLWTGRGMYFDGVDDSLEVSDNNTLDITDSISVLFWVKGSSQTNKGIVSKRKGAAEHTFAFRTAIGTGAKGTFIINDDGDNQTALDSQTDIFTDEWVYVAVVYDGSTMKIYVNGVEDSTTAKTGSINTQNDPLLIGYYGTYFFAGLIDEAMLFSRALSAAEIAAYYQATRGEYGV